MNNYADYDDYDDYADYADYAGYAEDYDDYGYTEDYKFDDNIDGIELEFIGEVYPTSRCLLYNPDGRLFEMQALARGIDSKMYFVRWVFEDNGEESFDAYDYSKPYECVLIDYPINWNEAA